MKRLLMALCAAASLAVAAEDYEMRLEPPAPNPGEEQLLPVTDAKAWISPAERPAVEFSADKTGLAFSWNGKTNNAAPHPVFGRVESIAVYPFKRGADDRVRLTIDLAVDKIEPDSELMPILIMCKADGTKLFEMDIYPPDYQMYINTRTAPERPRRIDRTFVVPKDAEALRLAFEFRGNKIDAKAVRIGLSPAHSKPKWDLEGHWLAAKRPDIPYGPIADPVPDVPLLSEEEVVAMLEKAPRLVPRLEKSGDRVKFTVNGVEEPFTIGWSTFNKACSYRQNQREMGFKLFMMPVCLGPRADTNGWPFNVWIDDDKYDFDKVAAGIRDYLRYVPDAKIVLYLRVTLPTAWAEKHPDAIFTNEKGERAVSEWSRVNRYGNPPPQGEREFYEACNVSKEFREGASKAIEALGKYLESVPEGKVVIGAYIHGGADTQWFYSFEPEFADYSPGALASFRDYLREKYQNDEKKLSRSWGKKVTFKNAGMPTFTERRRRYGADPNVPRSPLMEYNHLNNQCADYNEFMSLWNTRRQIAFSHALKKGSNGRLLTGTYWPTLPAAYPLAHTNFIEMLNSPDVDFISRGGIPGVIFRGKMTVAEFDLRNVRSGLDAWVDYDHPFHAKSQAEFRRQVLAGFTAQLTIGGGYHLWDMGGGWHYHPTTRAILKECQQLANEIHDVPPLGDNYIGVFIDDLAANELTSVGQYYNCAAVQSTFQKMGWNWASGWEAVGVPVRFFLQEDALNPKLTLPRVAIFLNPLTMTVEEGAAIRKRFEKDGRVVVYMLTPGLAAPGTPENPSKITGFKITPDVPDTFNKVLEIAAEDPLLANMPVGSQLGLYDCWSEMAWTTSAVADEKSGKVLARYPNSKRPGMIVDRNDKRTKVWIGTPGAVNVPLLRNLAREAKMEPMVENDSSVFFGAGLLGVAAAPCGGDQDVLLPENIKVTKCLTGQKYTVDGRHLRFSLLPAETFGDVAVFSVEGK